MFDSVLVANRGEIAVRIMRTLRALGIRSVAVYSDADRGGRHVHQADVAIRLGPAAASESYLSIERVIDAAVRSGAQALHPGYGFLAENAALAEACAAAGITFVGPPPAAIATMGDKITAKRTVAAQGVRVVPGIEGDALDEPERVAELAQRLEDVGYPILIKPSAGGGGKGMRVVKTPTALAGEIAAARREAMGAFGDDRLLFERFVQQPRHIEVQVLADAHGTIVHLGERECSLQRRHQKVIEEAPSALLGDHHRQAIGEQAIAAARACGYVNAGTVEFIVPGANPDDMFFMEMNTRLQVEHPVTEMVWGVDLVELQLRVAAGERLPFRQEDLHPTGHAIEARVYAEDASRGFLPTGGSIVGLVEPTTSPNVRVDSALAVGVDVGSDYDPMLAKVIGWGTDRAAARRTLDAALASTAILGVTTNVGFLRTVLADPDVISGQLDTNLLERIVATMPPPATPRHVAAAAALIDLADAAAARTLGPPWNDAGSWRLGEPAWAAWRAIDHDGHVVTARVRAHPDGGFEVDTGDGSPARVELRRDATGADVVAGDSVRHVETRRAGATLWIASEGSSWSFTPPPPIAPGAQGHAGDATVTSPMPGTVISVSVTAGEAVEAEQAIVVVEAMKMEHTLRAPIAGTVAAVNVKPGDRVALNDVLAVIDPSDTREES